MMFRLEDYKLSVGQMPSMTLLLLAIGVGCEQGKTPVGVAESESPAAVKPAETQDTSKLEEAGITFRTDASNQVSEVDLREVALDDELATEVSRYGALVKLTLGPTTMTMKGWESLAQLTNLQQLDLRASAIGNEELSSLVSGMSNLRAVRLSGQSGATSVDDSGLAALKNCPQLKALALDHLWVGGDGLKLLTKNQNLSELYLAGTLVDDEALDVIAQFPNIKKLRLAQTSISHSGLSRLAGLGIEDLDISECSQVFDDAMQAVGSMKSLIRLNLWRDAITDEGISQLSGLTKLQWLNLDNTRMTDESLNALRNMTELTFLHLGSTGVSDAGMPDLLSLKSLKDLKVTRTAVTEAGVQVVTAGIPGVDVQLKYVEGE